MADQQTSTARHWALTSVAGTEEGIDLLAACTPIARGTFPRHSVLSGDAPSLLPSSFRTTRIAYPGAVLRNRQNVVVWVRAVAQMGQEAPRQALALALD